MYLNTIPYIFVYGSAFYCNALAYKKYKLLIPVQVTKRTTVDEFITNIELFKK